MDQGSVSLCIKTNLRRAKLPLQPTKIQNYFSFTVFEQNLDLYSSRFENKVVLGDLTGLFHHFCYVETESSHFHKMIVSVAKMIFRKLVTKMEIYKQ